MQDDIKTGSVVRGFLHDLWPEAAPAVAHEYTGETTFGLLMGHFNVVCLVHGDWFEFCVIELLYDDEEIHDGPRINIAAPDSLDEIVEYVERYFGSPVSR